MSHYVLVKIRLDIRLLVNEAWYSTAVGNWIINCKNEFLPLPFRNKLLTLGGNHWNQYECIGVKSESPHALVHESTQMKEDELLVFLQQSEPILLMDYSVYYSTIMFNNRSRDSNVYATAGTRFMGTVDPMPYYCSSGLIQTKNWFMYVPQDSVDDAIRAGFVFCRRDLSRTGSQAGTKYTVTEPDYYETEWYNQEENGIEQHTSLVFEEFWTSGSLSYSMIHLTSDFYRT